MPRKPALEEKVFSIIKVAGTCTNRSIGSLCDRFTLSTLSKDAEREFNNHLKECITCAARVKNFHTMREASEYYQIPIGRKLDRLLKELVLAQPPVKWMRQTSRVADLPPSKRKNRPN